jgi:hypothetical protein
VTLKNALDYHERGWNPVRLYPPGGPTGRAPKREQWSKRPCAPSGWQNNIHTRDSIISEWSNDNNVGIVLGESSGWLVDIDLDCEESIVLARKFLPETMTFGRDSAMNSHWLYIAKGASTEKFTSNENSHQVTFAMNHDVGCGAGLSNSKE